MIDLSSDTQTRPSPAMREFMAAAPVGDEQLREDPSVNQLRRWIVWGSVAGFFGALSLMLARFFLPRAI